MNITLDDTVLQLKLQLLEILRTNEKQKIDLQYAGIIMAEEEKISTYLNDYNRIIFAIEKFTPSSVINRSCTICTTVELDNMLSHFEISFSKNPDLKRKIMKAAKFEVVKELITCIPEFWNDPVAKSIFKDSYLLETIINLDFMKIQKEQHPALLIAIDYLLEYITEDNNMNFSDEDFSESDVMEYDYSEILENQSRSLENYNPEYYNVNNMGVPRNSGNYNEENIQPQLGLSSQLLQMHELGLLNDILNFRALQLSNGDVREAVELIFSGILNE